MIVITITRAIMTFTIAITHHHLRTHLATGITIAIIVLMVEADMFLFPLILCFLLLLLLLLMMVVGMMLVAIMLLLLILPLLLLLLLLVFLLFVRRISTRRKINTIRLMRVRAGTMMMRMMMAMLC